MTSGRADAETTAPPNAEAPALTQQHVQRELELIHQKHKHRSRRTALFARLADSTDEGAMVKVPTETETLQFRLVSTTGELDLRQKLANEDDEPRVYLVPFARRLPRDIESTLAAGRLFWPQAESLLPQRFGAKSCTPRLRGSKLRLVAQRDGTRTYAKGDAPSIDLDDAWLLVLRNRLEPEPTSTEAHFFAAMLLDRERRGSTLGPILADVKDAREELAEVLDRRLGTCAPWILQAWLEDVAVELGAMAIVGEVARATLNDTGSLSFQMLMTALEQRVRLVPKHPLVSLPEAELAKTLIDLGYLVPQLWPKLDGAHGEASRQAILHEAEQVFAGKQTRPLARGSNRLPMVLTQRCQALLEALETLVANPERPSLMEAVDTAATELLAHDGAAQDAQLRQQVEMATRLAAFLADAETRELTRPAEGPHAEVVRLAHYQANVGGWVDYARQVARADESGILRKGPRGLVAAVDAIRDDFDARFATAYARVVGNGDRGALRGAVRYSGQTRQALLIEDVLNSVGVDVLKQSGDLKLLILCMDGMSWANLAELWGSIRRTSFVPVSRGPRLPVVAHVPTITRLSRSALFAGRALTTSDKLDTSRDGERLGKHEGIRRLGETPVTMLRGDILGDGGGLASQANKQVREGPRVVAVVVNAIDDQLKGAAQLRVSLSIEKIGPLRALLEAAEDTGRLVLLTSDHGNVTWRRFAGAMIRAGKDPEGMDHGARHRFLRAGETASSEEIELPVGALAQAKSVDRVAVAVHESLRYTTLLHAGEHGGATLAEAIAPAVLLAPRGLLPTLQALGVMECPLEPPRFWELGAARAACNVMMPAELATPEPIVSKKTGQAALAFEPPSKEAAPPVFEALVKSKFYQAQLKQLPENHRASCQQAIELLIRRGGRMAQDPFAAEMRISFGARVAGFVQRLEQVLNVEAEPVVELDERSRMVTLDVPRLRSLFLENGDG